MDIVGRGFLATNLAPLADRHPHALLLAAGVSTTVADSGAAFRRERDLLRRHLARCRAEGKQLIFFSSASHSIYGTSDVPVDEACSVHPTSPYGLHKLGLEHVVRESDTDWLILRLSHVVGPGQREHQTLPSLIRQASQGFVRVFRGAHRDFIDVRDVSAALDGLLTASAKGEIVNVATGTPYPVVDVLDGIERRLGVRPEREMVDVPPTRTPVSVEKLRRLAPHACPTGGHAYLGTLLDRYVAPLARR